MKPYLSAVCCFESVDGCLAAAFFVVTPSRHHRRGTVVTKDFTVTVFRLVNEKPASQSDFEAIRFRGVA